MKWKTLNFIFFLQYVNDLLPKVKQQRFCTSLKTDYRIPLPFFQLMRALLSNETKDKTQSKQEKWEWGWPFSMGQDVASNSLSQHCKNHFRMRRGASTALIKWVCRSLGTFLEACTQNTRQRKSYHYPREPVVWKDERLASGSCREWWRAR